MLKDFFSIIGKNYKNILLSYNKWDFEETFQPWSWRKHQSIKKTDGRWTCLITARDFNYKISNIFFKKSPCNNLKVNKRTINKNIK